MTVPAADVLAKWKSSHVREALAANEKVPEDLRAMAALAG